LASSIVRDGVLKGKAIPGNFYFRIGSRFTAPGFPGKYHDLTLLLAKS
jgi:hypothetical protein